MNRVFAYVFVALLAITAASAIAYGPQPDVGEQLAAVGSLE
jgi:hypothetical protein